MSSAFIPLLRSAFLYLSKQPQLRKWFETSRSAQPLTRRFVAGLTLDDAIPVVEELGTSGASASLDYLGENVRNLAEAAAAREAYLQALDRIRSGNLHTTVSAKLTALGLDLDRRQCVWNAEALVEAARDMGTRVEFDMEGSDYTDRTLGIVHRLHKEFGAVRAVIQAYLYRSVDDVDALCEAGIPVRLCKGAYRESPDVAFPKKSEVDENYRYLMQILFDHGTHPAIATHDAGIVDRTMSYARENGIAADEFEFQMLYGVRRDLQNLVLTEGYRLRVYVPYGAAWYPYFMRRLAERPANVMFVARSLFE